MTACTASPTPALAGLTCPEPGDVRDTVLAMFGPQGPARWSELLLAADTGDGSPVTAGALIEAMCDSAHPVLRLCGQAQRIRLRTYEQISARGAGPA